MLEVGIMLLQFFHYGKREHISQFFIDGSIQIGTMRAYDEKLFGDAIGDDEEGIVYQFSEDGDKEILDRLGFSNLAPDDPLSYGVGVEGNIVIDKNFSFNYAIFCMSNVLHRELCQKFSPDYDCALYIWRPFPFFHELTNSFSESKLSKNVEFQHVCNIDYRDRIMNVEPDVFEAIIKPHRFAYQSEVRALWNVGQPQQAFYRFKSPGAIRCCKMISLEDMPTYKPGASKEEVKNAMLKAINS
jgi:hypothetical protein